MTNPISRATVERWVAEYERAWHDRDTAAVSALFSPDARYRHSPYEPDLVGAAAIAAEWVDPRPFEMTTEVIAVEADRAVVRAEVDYDDPPQQYRDLWVIRFDDEGRALDFEEWAYWPGLDYTAD